MGQRMALRILRSHPMIPDTIFQQGRCQMCGALVEASPPTNFYGDIRITSQPQWKKSHIQYHENMVSREEAKAMSSVRWCDPGNHPFKAGSPGAQTMVGAEMDENGKPVAVEMDICPDHTQKGAERLRKALEAQAKENEYGGPVPD